MSIAFQNFLQKRASKKRSFTAPIAPAVTRKHVFITPIDLGLHFIIE
jgi:hypothetical protein